jgi:hypothetical protein
MSSIGCLLDTDLSFLIDENFPGKAEPVLVRPVPRDRVKPLPWSSPATLDGTDDLNLVLLRLFVDFHFAPPDTSLSVLESSYQCVVGLTVTVEAWEGESVFLCKYHLFRDHFEIASKYWDDY